jgi:hypothetical protein
MGLVKTVAGAYPRYLVVRPREKSALADRELSRRGERIYAGRNF